MGEQGNLGQWLEERCKKEHLSLRQAGARTGLSHATISDIKKGGHPSATTIVKLAKAFSGNGTNARLALEDKLLTLAGCRTERPLSPELNESVARLMDKVGGFSEPRLKMMARFADFLMEIEGED